MGSPIHEAAKPFRFEFSLVSLFYFICMTDLGISVLPYFGAVTQHSLAWPVVAERRDGGSH